MELTDEIRAQIKAQLTAAPKAKSRPNRQRLSAGLWARPFHSDSLGCNPEQIEETRANLRAHGVMADFDEEGRCIITSDKQYREVAKASGLWDGRDGYQVKDYNGHTVTTGRDGVNARRKLRAQLEKEARGYPSDFQGPL
jgi:hypothetical protein